jgi:CheY-like chemotaxis protein
MAPGSDQHDLPEAAPQGSSPVAACRGSTRRPGVLVVDEEACVRGVLGTLLRGQGFVVLLAASGLEAVTLYRQHGREIDAVVLDVRMPGLDGPQTLAALRQLDPHVRSVFLTGVPARTPRASCARPGAHPPQQAGAARRDRPRGRPPRRRGRPGALTRDDSGRPEASSGRHQLQRHETRA